MSGATAEDAGLATVEVDGVRIWSQGRWILRATVGHAVLGEGGERWGRLVVHERSISRGHSIVDAPIQVFEVVHRADSPPADHLDPRGHVGISEQLDLCMKTGTTSRGTTTWNTT